jgi:hypothetical protein
MRFSTMIASSALAATALAAPNAQGRPWGYGPPVKPTSTKKTTSSTKAASTSSGVVISPTGGSTCSASTVTTTSVGIATLTVTQPGLTSTITDVATVTDVATETEYETEFETATVTDVLTVTEPAAPAATITVTATANSTAPFPTSSPSVPDVPDTCMNQNDADMLAEAFRKLIQDYSAEFALNALTEDFVDYSSAVNIIMNKGAQYPKNITGPTFASRATFMAGQGSQPKIPFERLQTFHGCDHVVVRWLTTRSGNGQPKEQAMIPVIGNGILHVVPAEANNPGGYRFRIQTLYSEFNAAAWLVNNGVYTPAGKVDYINKNGTVVKRSFGEDTFDASLRGPAI